MYRKCARERVYKYLAIVFCRLAKPSHGEKGKQTLSAHSAKFDVVLRPLLDTCVTSHFDLPYPIDGSIRPGKVESGKDHKERQDASG